MSGTAGPLKLRFYERFVERFDHLLGPLTPHWAEPMSAGHLFAFFFQIRRAFHHIFRHIIGGSQPIARLRAAVWESIFTHDMRRYRRVLYQKMGDVTTLITGPSGTGKELVARAIGLSRYIPFDEKSLRFTDDFVGSFYAINISALSTTLIESELFGHRRGAFTGALQDRAGFLEACPPLGAVFLDEVGEIDAGVQVKLLRVLQTRSFHRLGDSAARRFAGKIIAATNRDLPAEIEAGRFRSDFYYRLCADLITTPSLREQIDESPDELGRLVHFLSEQVVGAEEAERLTDEVLTWISSSLGDAYAWPGNVRELEQCVRNVLIRGAYRPARTAPTSTGDALAAAVREGRLTSDELLNGYYRLIYERAGNLVEAARHLGVDRRTVRGRIDLGR